MNSRRKVEVPPFKAVIFDMDGVLVDSEPIYIEIEQSNFRALGLNILEEEHLKFQGTTTRRMWQVLTEKYQLKQTVEELVEMTNAVVTPYFSSLKKLHPIPGVESLIKDLQHEKKLLAVASSSSPKTIEVILQKTGLKKYFNIVVDSTKVAASKPEPDIFLLAAERLGVEPHECIVIEDSTNGIQAAKRAGMFCIAYAGPGAELQDHSQADMIISDFETLLQQD